MMMMMKMELQLINASKCLQFVTAAHRECQLHGDITV